jgi:NAD-dependent SIR2 family protein deacetylase
MANPEWFERNPRLAWAFYGHRLNLYRAVKPHNGFKQLLEIAEKKSDGYFVFTSNVDGQFQKAGFSETLIEEAHGSIHHLQCTEPCCSKIWSAENTTISVDSEKFLADEPLPVCPKCGKTARPNILMFGDWSWISERSNDQGKKFQSWLKYLKKQKSKLAIVEIVAGTAVPTVRHKSSQICREINANLIRINPRDFDLPAGNHVAVTLGAAEGINKICENR